MEKQKGKVGMEYFEINVSNTNATVADQHNGGTDETKLQ